MFFLCTREPYLLNISTKSIPKTYPQHFFKFISEFAHLILQPFLNFHESVNICRHQLHS